MPVVPLPRPRHSVRETPTALRFTIPVRRRWPVLFLTGGMFAMLAVFVVALVAMALDPRPAPPPATPTPTPSTTAYPPSPITQFAGGLLVGIFGLLWVGFAVTFLGWTLLSTLWQLAGREEIVVDAEGLTLARRLLGLGRARTYLREHVSGLRVAPSLERAWPERWWGDVFSLAPWRGQLAFDYGPRTIRCAADVDEAEARQIRARILARYPAYGRGEASAEEA